MYTSIFFLGGNGSNCFQAYDSKIHYASSIKIVKLKIIYFISELNKGEDKDETNNRGFLYENAIYLTRKVQGSAVNAPRQYKL